MDNETARQIGDLVVATVDNSIRNNSGNKYTLFDYIGDHEGSEKELNIILIKWAAKLL